MGSEIILRAKYKTELARPGPAILGRRKNGKAWVGRCAGWSTPGFRMDEGVYDCEKTRRPVARNQIIRHDNARTRVPFSYSSFVGKNGLFEKEIGEGCGGRNEEGAWSKTDRIGDVVAFFHPAGWPHRLSGIAERLGGDIVYSTLHGGDRMS